MSCFRGLEDAWLRGLEDAWLPDSLFCKVRGVATGTKGKGFPRGPQGLTAGLSEDARLQASPFIASASSNS